jgi:hypothetical protein
VAPKSWGFHQVIPMFLKVPDSLEGASRTPNNSLQPWTPAPHRTPALAGGARGCGENTRTPAQTAGTGSSTDPAGGRRVGASLASKMRENEWAVACNSGRKPAIPVCP